MKFLESSGVVHVKISTFEGEGQVIHLAPLTTKKIVYLVVLFGFWRKHIPNMGVLLQCIYLVTRKADGFEWDPEEEKAMQ